MNDTKVENKIRFSVWAPGKKRMVLHLVSPLDREIEMHKNEEGCFWVEVEKDQQPFTYFLKPDGEKDYPDPASHYQPEGVHGPSQIVDHSLFNWSDKEWKGLQLKELIIYELHVGTFTPEGSFEAMISRLDELRTIGINAIEIMPVSQFPGSRNWGYDGVFPYAVQNSYGGPDGLKRLVNACHLKGIAVIVDVVYNHLGPEGNYLTHFGPYFTTKYRTPWGDAINFDGEWSDGVRDYFANNALFWFEQYHVDGLRCDAIHTVFDNGAIHFWEQACRKVKVLEARLGRSLHMIAESDLNSPRVVKTPEAGGYGFSAQWLDDFHHALYVFLNKEDKDRYYDFGKMQQLAKAYEDGFVHSGEFVRFRKRKHGASSAGVDGNQFIVFNQNHDQIGNRVGGERLSMLVDTERLKLAAAAIFLSPYVPMLFMGEEYGDDTPFFYFVSHSDAALVEAVRKGRKEEFKDFGFNREPPDPQDEQTFNRSKINWESRKNGTHSLLLEWHRELIRMRQTLPVLKNFLKKDIQAQAVGEEGVILFRQTGDMEDSMLCLFNFSERELDYTVTPWRKKGRKILDSKEAKWTEKPVKGQKLHPMEIEANQPLALLPLSISVYAMEKTNA
jgi:maltooligosyltrehalose trehalohydrolase